MVDEHLVSVIASAGKAALVETLTDGTGLLVMPYGGRVLGLFTPESSESFYWVHPALGSVQSARSFYESPSWHNSGGDRTWLAPEVDLFYPRYPDLSIYTQPKELDPGDYRVTRDGGRTRLVNQVEMTSRTTSRRFVAEISKSFAPAASPVRRDSVPESAGRLEYAGYAQHTSLAFIGTPNVDIGLWNLVQLPHGGEMLVPTHRRAKPRTYFGHIATEDMAVGEHMLRYRMRASGVQKIGCRAADVTGRMGYVYRCGNEWSLVVRSISVDPSGDYIDVPVDDLADTGYCMQACNVDLPELGSYAELEYHVPAIGPGGGRNECSDVSQVWAYRGAYQAVEWAAAELLGIQIRGGPE